MSDKNHSSHKEAIQLDWKLDTTNKKSNSSKYNMRPGSIQKRGSSRLFFVQFFPPMERGRKTHPSRLLLNDKRDPPSHAFEI